MIVSSVRQRGLRRLIENDDPHLLPPDLVNRVRRVLTALLVAENIETFVDRAPRGWRVHRLSGSRQQEWSVSVSGNWRVTFTTKGPFVEGLDLEDYH